MKKPKGLFKLELLFDTETGVRNARASLIDGGADQQMGYYTDAFGKDWIHLTPGDDACHNCEFDNSLTDRAFGNDDNICQNCGADIHEIL